MIAKHKDAMPYMKSLAACLSRMVGQGYTEKFKATGQGLVLKKNNKIYAIDQVNIVNFFRFAGNSDPGNNASMYIIETKDGIKGTLVESSHSLSKLPYASVLNSVWTHNDHPH